MAIAILGYQIDELLHESHNSLIYRGVRLSDNQSVILKLLNQAYPSPEKIAQFKREYEITRFLNLPGAIDAYSLETADRRWVAVIEDFGGLSLQQIVQNQLLTVSEFFPIAINIAEILDGVHQQQVIHKDINPSNIVFNPATRKLKLIDFGISTKLSRENPNFRNPNLLEGTLAYISPEQTGRMNRSVDYRTDFYSLGATFYELLTGTVPFTTTDPLELVHCHLAQQPTPPHQLNPDIPEALSRIILKLMSKNAENRYQSAYGLQADLEECWRQWQESGRIDSFVLAQSDISDRFQIPQKLYGREREIERLLSGFERVCSGSTEMMLVAGYSGIGKSALVQEVYKPITRQRGYFISGKFDQLQRDIPYASLVQAFRSLILQLLTESPAQIAAWREKLLAAFGSNAQVIIKVIPEVAAIVGAQPDVPELPGTEAENRFKLVFQNFIQVFTQPEHPLVIFLDDLQWSDSASLKLLELLITAPDSQYLYIIGAYRDNEVSSAHPLMLTLEEIQKTHATVNQIVLTPLSLNDIAQLIADTLNNSPEIARPLAELVAAKTNGNPFFINEFLKALYADRLLTFDFSRRTWQWNIHQIGSRNITENVVELMVTKLKKLPEQTQQCLKLAACIGYRFSLETLAIVSEKSRQETAAALWQAISENLILPLGDEYKLMEVDEPNLATDMTVEYKFAHDRIQQAAYSLIPETEKQTVHWQVGQLLLQSTPPECREQNIFQIVHQLNLGRGSIAEISTEELLKLNQMAGKKAKASAAFKTASRYFKSAINLLDRDSWKREYDFTLTLYLEAMEAASFGSDYTSMEQVSEVILQQAKTVLDTVKVYELNMQAYYAQHQLSKAMKSGLQILEGLEIPLPEKPTQSDIVQTITETRALWAGKRIPELIALPPMSDPYKLAATRVLISLSTAASVGFPELYPIVLLRMTGLFIQFGNTSQSPIGYVAYSLLLCGLESDLESGYQFGKLALDLLERLKIKEVEIKALYVFNTFVQHWKKSLNDSLKNFLKAYQVGLETGDIVYGGMALWMYCVHSYWAGKDIIQLERDIVYHTTELIKLKQELSLQWMESFRESIFKLLTPTDEEPWTLNSETFDETSKILSYQQKGDRIALCLTYLNKIMLCYLFERFPEAVENVALGQEYVGMAIAMYTVALFNLYDSLTHLAIYPDSPEPEQQRILEKVTANQEKMQLWAQHAPMNYLHKYYLVEAERDRVLNEDSRARDSYDRAISLAKEHEYLNEEALAYELAARFYLSRNITHLARFYLQEAHYAYQRWGATAKVKHLEKLYPQLLDRRTSTVDRRTSTGNTLTVTATSGSSSGETLDLATVLKASQAISSEIKLDKLLSQLLTLAIENAGAQKGVLILSDNNQLKLAAAKLPNGDVQILNSLPLETNNLVPPAIINYVARTQENIVLADATKEGIFTREPYIIQQQPQSVLCAAIVNQGQLRGILYLENNLATGAFTPERIQLLQVVSAQAAISLENAQLYRTLEDKVIERTAQLAEANQEISALNEMLKSENLRMSAELDVTRQLQQKILPAKSELHEISDLEIAGFMEPADEVGGDYYDILNYDGRVKISIGDVTGHGLESGMLMLMVQTAVRTLMVNEETDYVKFLTTVNRTIFDNVVRMRSEKNLTLALLDYRDRILTISGQHEEVLVVRTGGTVEQIDTMDLGFPIGLDTEIADFISQTQVELNPGDAVVLYTDGITEAENLDGEQYGLERLCKAIGENWQLSAEEIRAAAIADLRRHIGEQKVFDDITIVVLKQK